jgi:hypothetical protein
MSDPVHPLTAPLTMTAEQEASLRSVARQDAECDLELTALFAEIDALRSQLEQAQRECAEAEQRGIRMGAAMARDIISATLQPIFVGEPSFMQRVVDRLTPAAALSTPPAGPS